MIEPHTQEALASIISASLTLSLLSQDHFTTHILHPGAYIVIISSPVTILSHHPQERALVLSKNIVVL